MILFKDTWKSGDIGHTAEHNRIARRLNTSCIPDAVGDGIADDTLAIQSALDLGLPEYWLPKSAYLITAPLRLKAGQRISGSGWKSTRIVAGSELEAMLILGGTQQTSINNCRIDNISLHGGDRADIGIKLDYARDANAITDVYVQECGKGIALGNGSWINKIADCIVKRCGRGIELLDNSNSITLQDCNLEYNASAGLWMQSSYGMRVNGCQFSANGGGGVEQAGLWIRGGGGIYVSGGYFEGNGTDNGYNILIEGQAAGVAIIGCHLTGLDMVTRYGVAAYSCRGVNILANHSERHISSMVYVGDDGEGVVCGGCSTTDPQPIIGNGTMVW